MIAEARWIPERKFIEGTKAELLSVLLILPSGYTVRAAV